MSGSPSPSMSATVTGASSSAARRPPEVAASEGASSIVAQASEPVPTANAQTPVAARVDALLSSPNKSANSVLVERGCQVLPSEGVLSS